MINGKHIRRYTLNNTILDVYKRKHSYKGIVRTIKTDGSISVFPKDKYTLYPQQRKIHPTIINEFDIQTLLEILNFSNYQIMINLNH